MGVEATTLTSFLRGEGVDCRPVKFELRGDRSQYLEHVCELLWDGSRRSCPEQVRVRASARDPALQALVLAGHNVGVIAYKGFSTPISATTRTNARPIASRVP